MQICRNYYNGTAEKTIKALAVCVWRILYGRGRGGRDNALCETTCTLFDTSKLREALNIFGCWWHPYCSILSRHRLEPTEPLKYNVTQCIDAFSLSRHVLMTRKGKLAFWTTILQVNKQPHNASAESGPPAPPVAAWAGVGHWRRQRVTTRAENRMKAFYQFTVNGFTMMTFINAPLRSPT